MKRMIHKILCYFGFHEWNYRLSSGAFLIGSSINFEDSDEKKCFWCDVYFVKNKKVRDDFYIR